MELNGEQVLIGDFALNITERKQAELILRESEERFSKIFQSSPVSIAISTFKEGRYVDVNNAFVDTLGYDSKDEVIGRTSAELGIWADLTERSKVVEELRQHRLIRNMEFRVRTRSGEVRDTLLTLERIEINHQPFTLGFATDITERKKAAEKLQASEDRLREFLDATPDALVIVNKDGKIILVNQQVEKLFGYTRDELLDETLEILIPKRFRASHLTHRADFFANPHAREMGVGLELYALRKDGSEFPVEVSLSHHKIEDDVVVLSSIRDITERKRLELQQNRLATALKAAGEVILITDADANIQYVNPAFEHITGYTREEAIGRKPNILKSGKHGEDFYRLMWGALLQGDVWHGVITNKKKSGDLFEAEQTIAPIQDKSGGTLGYVTVMRDITERVQRERELEAIAQLSVAIANRTGACRYDAVAARPVD